MLHRLELLCRIILLGLPLALLVLFPPVLFAVLLYSGFAAVSADFSEATTHFVFAGLLLLMGLFLGLLAFLNRRQRTALSIAFTFFRLGTYFLLGYSLALALIATGILALAYQWIAGACMLLLGVLLLALQTGRLLAFRRETRSGMTSTLRKHGFCVHCGYDLRAATTRCPECGFLIPPERRAQANIEV